MTEQKPAWQQIVDLFKKHGYEPPPTMLRDELVTHLVAYQEQRKTGYGPFDGYVVLNTRRKAVVFGGDDREFVWDDQDIAEEHMREGEADEVRRVRVTVLPE
jgi:hypothetical protein